VPPGIEGAPPVGSGGAPPVGIEGVPPVGSGGAPPVGIGGVPGICAVIIVKKMPLNTKKLTKALILLRIYQIVVKIKSQETVYRVLKACDFQRDVLRSIDSW